MCTKLTYFFLTILLTGSLLAQGVDPGTENLTHSWTFEDGTANDYIGGANGTLVGGASVDEGELWLLEEGQYMEMPAADIGITDYEEITLKVWYRPLAESNTGYTMLAYFGDTVNDVGADGYFITSARGNDVSRAAISCGNYTAPYNAETGVNGTEYDDGELHHKVSTLTYFDITLSIDGVLAGTTPMAETNRIDLLSTNFAYLAKGGYAADPTWLGEILEFNIYSKALTEDEVLYLYNKGPATSAVDDKEIASLPTEYCLLQNYPNPFNPTTNITFELPKQSEVHIAVYDLLGQELARLVDGSKPAGRHTVQFDSKNLSSGLYICRMDINNQIFTKRMMLLK